MRNRSGAGKNRRRANLAYKWKIFLVRVWREVALDDRIWAGRIPRDIVQEELVVAIRGQDVAGGRVKVVLVHRL